MFTGAMVVCNSHFVLLLCCCIGNVLTDHVLICVFFIASLLCISFFLDLILKLVTGGGEWPCII